MAEAVVAEGGAEAPMVEVDTSVGIVAGTQEDSTVDTLAAVIEAGTLEDSAVGILAGDPVFPLYLEEPTGRIMLLLYLEDTLVVTGVGIMEGTMADTMAVM